MSVRSAPPVDDQPFVEITQWTVFQFPDGDRHLVGYIGKISEGRVSSKIMSRNDRVLTTRSGRKYRLVGEPGYDDDANYVWRRWCEFNSVDPDSAIDVSADYNVQ